MACAFRSALWIAMVATAAAEDHRIDVVLKETACPAALVAVAEPGSPPEIHSLGQLAPNDERPLPTDTPMRIGSVTKLFVGTLILRLADDGTLSLDNRISSYVDGIPGGDTITLEMLGHHRSGLPDSIRNAAFRKAIVDRPDHLWTPKEILEYAFSQKPFFKPGEGFRYSNTNTILLALAAEEASGKKLNDLLAKHIYQPLGLKHTRFPGGTGSSNPDLRAFRHAPKDNPIGYGKVFTDVTHLNASWGHAAGDMVSTIDDLAKAAPALCSGKLLSDQGKARLLEWTDTGTDGWRYGFCIEQWDGFTGHRGDVPGYSAAAALGADATAYAILTNLSNTPEGKSPAALILRELARKPAPTKRKD
ncbi:MAG: serine hydrolase domain-containing protein [Verrucomicrobiota bacterium]